MTTDNLERDSFFNAGTAPVYAGVYTKYSQDGEWEQIGPMFEGTATVKGYDGNIFGAGSKIASECAYRDELMGANDEESAFNIANNLIKRTFEMYLDYII